MDENPPPKTLPDDVLIEIFARLPVKTLLQVRCVSKSWHAVISHDCNRSIKKLPSLMCGLFNKNNKNKLQFTGLKSRTYIDSALIDTGLTFLPSSLHHNLDILDCCNGLLLLTDSSTFLYTCNPATKRWAQFSKPPTDFMAMVLAFDPHHSRHYRVISFPKGGSDEVEVYSSATSEWREIQGVRGLDNICLQRCRFVFLNGMLYVLEIDHGRHIDNGCTFAVDVEGKVCQRIRRPELGLKIGLSGHCLGRSGGRLHYALMVAGKMLVWVLEDSQNNEYVLKHRNSVRAIVDKLPGGEFLPDYVGILAFHPDLDVIFLRLQNKLFSYHLVSSQLQEICSFEGGRPCFAYTPCYSEELDLQADM